MRSLLATASLALGLAVPAVAQNFVVVLLDDVGIDRVGAYGAHPEPGLLDGDRHRLPGAGLVVDHDDWRNVGHGAILAQFEGLRPAEGSSGDA